MTKIIKTEKADLPEHSQKIQPNSEKKIMLETYPEYRDYLKLKNEQAHKRTNSEIEAHDIYREIKQSILNKIRNQENSEIKKSGVESDNKTEVPEWTKEDEDKYNKSQEIIRVEKEKIENIKKRLAEIYARLEEIDELKKSILDKNVANIEDRIQEELSAEDASFDNEQKIEERKTNEDIVAEEEAFFEITKIKEDIDKKVAEPEQIKVEEIINESVTPEEKAELQKEFPDQNVEAVIENQVVEQINNKTIPTPEIKTKNTLLEKAARKVKYSLLILLVSATSFRTTSIFKSSDRAKALSYSNFKIDDLKDWENIKLHEDEINMRENISIITKAHENSNDKYLVIDKQNGKIHRYQGDNLIESYNACVGENIGDEQTELKSTYRIKGSDDGNFHRRQEVPIEEATYVEDGERYMKPGYESFTEWGKGNMKTGAGIYTISNKGPFLGDKALFLKNERGIQVATSLHVNIHGESDNPRLSNGCVGIKKEGIRELSSAMSIGDNVYILPDSPNNKYKIVDGELRFLSNQKDVNKTVRPYEPKSIVMKAENPTETAKAFLMSITENKAKLMKLYPTISNDVYNELAKLSYGIIGKESTFGTYGGPRGQFGRAKDVGLSTVGLNPSVGAGQVKLKNISQNVREFFNIRNTDQLFDTQKNAIAVISILLDNYLYVTFNGKESDYRKLVVLKYNAAAEAMRVIKKNKKMDELGPITRGYISKVLSYSEQAKVYTGDPSENYYSSIWNYNQPNN